MTFNSSMIKGFEIQNFKCFKDLAIELGSLTLLSGINGTGKSSIIQALLLLRGAFRDNPEPNILFFNNELIRLGTAKDALYEFAQEEKLGFTLKTFGGFTKNWEFDNYIPEADYIINANQALEKDNSHTPNINLFGYDFHYLQAERVGPRTYFEKSYFQSSVHKKLGTQGELAANFLAANSSWEIRSSCLCHPSESSLKLQEQLEAWLGEFCPGIKINLQSYLGMDLIDLKYFFNAGKGYTNAYRSTNVAFGVTYILPILIAILAAREGALLIIENPEAHLHPKGQAILGELFARAASTGIQLIIETHSDHILNGARVAIKKKIIDAEEVKLCFFRKNLSPDGPYSEVVTPKLDPNGRIDYWPEDFFDVWDKSLEELLKLDD